MKCNRKGAHITSLAWGSVIFCAVCATILAACGAGRQDIVDATLRVRLRSGNTPANDLRIDYSASGKFGSRLGKQTAVVDEHGTTRIKVIVGTVVLFGVMDGRQMVAFANVHIGGSSSDDEEWIDLRINDKSGEDSIFQIMIDGVNARDTAL